MTQPLNLYVCSMMLTQNNGLSTEIQPFTYTDWASSEEQMTGRTTILALDKYPHYKIANISSVDVTATALRYLRRP